MADAVEEIESHGFKRTLKDLFSGAVGGVAQVLLGELHFNAFSLCIVERFSRTVFFGNQVLDSDDTRVCEVFVMGLILSPRC